MTPEQYIKQREELVSTRDAYEKAVTRTREFLEYHQEHGGNIHIDMRGQVQAPRGACWHRTELLVAPTHLCRLYLLEMQERHAAAVAALQKHDEDFKCC